MDVGMPQVLTREERSAARQTAHDGHVKRTTAEGNASVLPPGVLSREQTDDASVSASIVSEQVVSQQIWVREKEEDVEKPRPRRFTFDFTEQQEEEEAEKLRVQVMASKFDSFRGGDGATEQSNRGVPDEGQPPYHKSSRRDATEPSHNAGSRPRESRSRSPMVSARFVPKPAGLTGNAPAKIERSSTSQSSSSFRGKSPVRSNQPRRDLGHPPQKSFREGTKKSTREASREEHVRTSRTENPKKADQSVQKGRNGAHTSVTAAPPVNNSQGGGRRQLVSVSPMSQRGRQRGRRSQRSSEHNTVGGGKSERVLRSSSIGSRTEGSSLGAAASWEDQENSRAAGRTFNQNIVSKSPFLSPESLAERNSASMTPLQKHSAPPSHRRRGASPSPMRQKRIEQAKKAIHKAGPGIE